MQAKLLPSKTEICFAIALIGLVTIVYFPGLYGEFSLDDFPNLFGLQLISVSGYLNYIFDGVTGSLGRPLSLLTFALQYSAWPGDPFAFKLVNLIIHLFNGFLVFLLCKLLARHLGIAAKQTILFSFFVAALWLLHPMQISTVLYVVQRMTELSTFFTLCGVCSYLYIRDNYKDEREIRGLFYNSLIIVIFGTLAVLSKENGILLPLFILVIETFALINIKKSLHWRIWAWCFLVFPLVLLGIYLAINIGSTLQGYASRPYTVSERLLTEAVIVVEYLKDLILPHPSAFTLFHDDFPVSTGFLSPPVTGISIGIIFSLLTVSFVYRKKYTVLAFGIFWFFAGHLLESTYLNLELYFEHRNYLPSVGIFIIIGFVFIYLLNRLPGRLVSCSLIGCLYLFLIIITIFEIRVWANPALQAIEWARIHPGSRRALNNLGFYYLINQKTNKALEVYDEFASKYPDDIYPYIKKISIIYCVQQERLDEQQWKNIYKKAKNATMYGTETWAELDSLTMSTNKGMCKMPDLINFARVILILADNPKFQRKRGDLHGLVAIIAVNVGDLRAALANINEALRLSPKPTTFMVKLHILMAAGLYDEARETLRKYKEEYKLNPKVYLSNKVLIEDIERQIRRMDVSH